MKYKVGDKVRIIGNSNAHDYSINQVVTLEEKTGPTEWHAGDWYVEDSDIEHAVPRTPTWQLEKPDGDYETAKDSEGNVVAYRPVPQIVEKVDRTVKVTSGPDGSWHMNAGTSSDNAKLFGETVNGKPVGDWIIRFEQDRDQT